MNIAHCSLSCPCFLDLLNKSLLFWHKTIKLAIVLSGALTLEDFQASPDSVLFSGCAISLLQPAVEEQSDCLMN